MSTSEKAQKWFAICDLHGKAKISAALAHEAKVRIMTAAGGNVTDLQKPKKPADDVTNDTFIKDLLDLIQKSERESDAIKELDTMISEVEVYGPPPVETGDPVRDMHAYRSYHGMDKALGYLLQKLVTEQPGDPVQDLIQRAEGMDKFAALRTKIGDQPYDDHI